MSDRNHATVRKHLVPKIKDDVEEGSAYCYSLSDTPHALTKAFPHESQGLLIKSRRGGIVGHLMISTNLSTTRRQLPTPSPTTSYDHTIIKRTR
jgi:hypothetical protein